MIARLIHLNGAPGVGKTSLARRYVADHPLMLVVDIDDLRTNLGQWATRDESRLLARELAIALVDCHPARRQELSALGGQHPEADVGADAVHAVVDDALALLADVAAARPRIRTVSAADDLDDTYRALLAALDGGTA